MDSLNISACRAYVGRLAGFGPVVHSWLVFTVLIGEGRAPGLPSCCVRSCEFKRGMS